MVAGVDGSGSWRNERTNEGGSEMIRESGSEKKKARFSDRSRSEVTKRERSGETSASAKLRKDTCERVKRAPVRICVCVCVWKRGWETGGASRGKERGRKRETEPLLLRFYSLRPSPSPLPLPLPSPLCRPTFPSLPSHRQKVINTLGRCVGEAYAPVGRGIVQVSRKFHANLPPTTKDRSARIDDGPAAAVSTDRA